MLLLAGLAGGLVWYAEVGRSQPIVIKWSDRQQTIDGFGASCADFLEPLSNQLADFFFTTRGLGFTLLRTQIFPGTSECEAFLGNGLCVATAHATISKGELAVAQQAASRGATVVSSSWSPPGASKDNGSFLTGGRMIGNVDSYTNYAAILASYVTLMSQYNIPVYALGFQNEPNVSQTYPSALWTPQQIHDFVPYLFSALSSAGFGATKIMVAEQYNWAFDYAASAMADPITAADVGILASHVYGSPNPTGTPSLANFTNQRIWQTEASSQTLPYDGSMSEALIWAKTIHAYFANAKINAWIWWFLTDTPRQGDGADNAALTDARGNIPLRAYVTGNWSRFVRPGWHEVGVTNDTSLLVTAFQDPLGAQSVVVAVNPSRFRASPTFSVGSAMRTATPWVTSSTMSLVSQESQTVSGGSFTYTIPARSVVTFVAGVPDSGPTPLNPGFPVN